MPITIKPTGIKECKLRTVETLSRRFSVWPNGCWEWVGHKNRAGYGQFTVKHIARHAHRVMWELTGNPVDFTLQLDHLCRNRSCVNPKHLEQVSARENTMRGDTVTAANATREYCKHGHPLSGDNLVPHLRKDRSAIERRCRICQNRIELNRKRRRGLVATALTKDDGLTDKPEGGA